MKSLINGSIVVFLVTTSIYAESVSLDTSYDVGLKAGSLGVGIEISTPINENLSIRFNINGASYSRSETEQEIDYDGDIDFLNAGLMLDYYPYVDSGFRLTGGAYYNGNELSAVATPRNGTYTLDGIDYDSDMLDVLSADGDFDEFAPYIGLGWGNNVKSEGFSFSLDVGVLISSPNVILDVTRGSATDAEWNMIQKSAENEQNAIDDDYNDIAVFPVVMLGVTYRF